MNIHCSALKAESGMDVTAPGLQGHGHDILSPSHPHADFRWRGLAFLRPAVNVQQNMNALCFPVDTNMTVTIVTLAVSQVVCPALHMHYLLSLHNNSLRQGVVPFYRRED